MHVSGALPRRISELLSLVVHQIEEHFVRYKDIPLYACHTRYSVLQPPSKQVPCTFCSMVGRSLFITCSTCSHMQHMSNHQLTTCRPDLTTSAKRCVKTLEKIWRIFAPPICSMLISHVRLLVVCECSPTRLTRLYQKCRPTTCGNHSQSAQSEDSIRCCAGKAVECGS